MLLRRLAEGDGDDALALGHALAGAQEERHAGPAPVVDRSTSSAMKVSVSDSAVDALLGAVARRTGRARRRAGSIGSMQRKTLFFSSLIGAGSSAVGGSIAMKPRIWNRCVTTMSR